MYRFTLSISNLQLTLPRRPQGIVNSLADNVRRYEGRVLGQAPCVDHVWAQVCHLAGADQTHVHLHLVLQQLHCPINTGQAVRRHGVQEGPADADTLGTEAKCLDDVRRPTAAAIDEDLERRVPLMEVRKAGTQHGGYFCEDFDTRACCVKLSPAVIG